MSLLKYVYKSYYNSILTGWSQWRSVLMCQRKYAPGGMLLYLSLYLSLYFSLILSISPSLSLSLSFSLSPSLLHLSLQLLSLTLFLSLSLPSLSPSLSVSLYLSIYLYLSLSLSLSLFYRVFCLGSAATPGRCKNQWSRSGAMYQRKVILLADNEDLHWRSK